MDEPVTLAKQMLLRMYSPQHPNMVRMLLPIRQLDEPALRHGPASAKLGVYWGCHFDNQAYSSALTWSRTHVRRVQPALTGDAFQLVATMKQWAEPYSPNYLELCILGTPGEPGSESNTYWDQFDFNYDVADI